MYNTDFFHKTGIKVSQDEVSYDLENERDEMLLEEIADNLGNSTQYTIEQIKSLIVKYPDIPLLYNYLVNAYQAYGDHVQAYKCIIETIKKFPDYFFGTIALAQYALLTNQDPKAAANYFGDITDIRKCIPGREVFYESEFFSYYCLCAKIAVTLGNYELAKAHLKTVYLFDKKDKRLIEAAQSVEAKHTQMEMMALTQSPNKKVVVWKKRDHYPPATDKPTLQHPELYALLKWEYDYIPSSKEINTIRALPRTTAIADLQTLLIDAMVRFDYYKDGIVNEDDYGFSHPRHVLAFLWDFSATEALPTVLNMLRCGTDFVDFWFGDFADRSLNPFLFKCAQIDLKPFLSFTKEENIGYYEKSLALPAVSQLPIHFPEKRQEVMDWCSDVLSHFLNNEENDNLIDTEYLSYLICEVADFRAKELLPIIEKINQKNWINPRVMGDFNEIVRELNSEFNPSDTHFFPETLQEWYDESYLKRRLTSSNQPIQSLNFLNDPFEKFLFDLRADMLQRSLSTKYEYDEDDEDDDDYETNDHTYTRYEEIGKSGKPLLEKSNQNIYKGVSQNAPCPCGSGKKYKRCHGA